MLSDRGYSAQTPDTLLDINYLCNAFMGRELICGRPPRFPCFYTQRLLETERIDLDDRPIRLEWKAAPLLLDLLNDVNHSFNIILEFYVLGCGEARHFEPLDKFPLALKAFSFYCP